MKAPKFLHFYFVFFVFLVQQTYGQCPNTNITSPEINIIDGVTDAICPYTQYTIVVGAGFPTDVYINSANPEVLFDLDGPGAGGWTANGCVSPGTTIYFIINALPSSGTYGIRTRTKGTGCTPLGTPTHNCLLNFTLAQSYITNVLDQTFCDGSDSTISLVCSTGVSACTPPPTLSYVTGVPSANGEYSVQWYENGGGVETDASQNNPIPFADYTLYPSPFQVTVVTSYHNGTEVCTYSDVINVTIAESPSITPIVFTDIFASIKASGETCIYDSLYATTTTTSTSNINYLWQYKFKSASTWTTGVNSGNINTGGHTFGMDPETGPYNPASTTANIAPGSYDLRVIATEVAGGCEDTVSSTFVVNDRPAVQIGWDDSPAPNLGGGGGGLTYTDDVEICAGSGITLELVECSENGASVFSTTAPHVQAFPNYRSRAALTDPNRPSSGITNALDAYNCPCLTTGLASSCNNSGTNYQNVTWSILRGTGSAFSNQTDLTVDNFTNVASLSASLSTPERITYQAEVTDANGCINTDTISILARTSPVEFNVGTNYYCSGATIPICPSTPAFTIRASGVVSAGSATPCAGSGNGYLASPSRGAGAGTTTNFDWVQTTGDLTPTTQSGTGSGNRNLTISSPSAASLGNHNWNMTMQDDWGCYGYGEINVDIDNLTITLNTTNPIVCYNEPLDLINSTDNGYTYDVYKGGTCNTTTGVCSGGTDVSESYTASGGIATITVPAGQVTTETYWVIASEGTTCLGVESIAITENPEITWGSGTTPLFSDACNNPSIILEAEATGGTGTLVYDWVASGTAIAGPAPPNSMGNASSNGSTGYYDVQFQLISLGWITIAFPVLVWVTTSTTQNSFTYEASIPAQPNAINELTVTDGAGCTLVREWDFEVLECGVPVILKDKYAGPANLPPAIAFNKYVCVEDQINFTCDIPGGTTYTPTYEWNSDPALNQSTHSVTVLPSSPDTIITWCTVYNGSEIVGAAIDTTIVSFPYVNMYPEVQASNPDTSICINDIVNAQANCFGCRGFIEYEWEGNTNGNIYSSNTAWDNYAVTGTAAGQPQFVLDLRVRHGEDCVDDYSRDIGVNDLPTIFLEDGSGNPIAGNPIYLCDGEVEVIQVNTAGCTGGCNTYNWNTTATTTTINVSSQGGYYAILEDGNSCRANTDVAIVIAANDGLNSVAVANPSQICNNGDVTLEVAPCIGCSYEWFTVPPGAAIASSRAHTITGAAAAGNYYAEVTNAEGCVYTSSQVSVSAASVTIPSITGTTDSLCDGATSTLSTPYNSNYTYQWYLNGGVISGAINSTYVASQTGAYSVVVSYANGCFEESPVFLITPVSYQPNIAVSSYIVCNGETADLQTNLYPGFQYQWYNDGVLITGATGAIYNANSSGSHYVEVTTDYLCVVRSDSVRITTSTLNSNPLATTPTPSLCPGEEAELSASICTGCNYQWFDENLSPITPAPNGSDFRYNFYPTHVGPKGYYVEVSKDGCVEKSDTIYITVNPVFTPAITSSSPVVCNGKDALLVTPSCVGCSYSWLINGEPVLGALNDTFHLVDNIIDTGNYQIAVLYPNGCADTSSILTINNGSYTVNLAIDTTGGVPLDSVICNTVGESLIAMTSSNLTGTYLYTLFLNNTPVSGYSNVTSNTFPGDNAGVYTTQVTDPRGCISLSNILPLRAVTVAPVLTARATSDPSSVSASAICTDSGTVFLEVSNCNNCSFVWNHGGNVILSTDTLVIDTFASAATPSGWVALGDWQVDLAANRSSALLPLIPENTSYVAAVNDQLQGGFHNDEQLILPPIDLSNTNVELIDGASLFFDAFANGYGKASVVVSTSGPFGPWVEVGVIPFNNYWQKGFTVDLTNYINSGTIRVAFQYNDFGLFSAGGFAVDNVLLTRNRRTTYITPTGTAGSGGYIVTGTNDGCSAVSTLITIADLTVIANPLNSNANATDTSICNGQSITLAHAASAGNPSLNCNGCSFRWLRNESPINGANNYQYVTGTPGIYQLEITTVDGCVDTSDLTNIRQVDPPAGLLLDFDSISSQGVGTPISSNGTPIGLGNWVYPLGAQPYHLNSGATGYFTSAPYSGILPPNAGLSQVNDTLFTPDDTLAGYHLISYHYDTLGCSFVVDDVLEVLPPASITVTNSNPASVPYEACVGDQLTINTTYLDFPIDSVAAFNSDGIYVNLSVSTPIVDTFFFGVDTVYNTTLVFTVPGYANASYLRLVNYGAGTPDTIFTSFVLIHNTDLSFTGLPNMLCSNGTPITLFGNPSGGSFSVADTNSHLNVTPAAANGDTIYPTALNPAYYQNGSQWVDVYYSYTETYTNGNLCPSNDTVSIRREVKDVRLTSVTFNNISVSQNQELLTNLVYSVTPYRARPNKQPLYTSSFSGSFTSPAGNPTNFLPKNAGIGTHPLTYSIESGSCMNSVQGNISVVAAPNPIAFPDTICRNYGTVNFGRDLVRYPLLMPGTAPQNSFASYTDTFHYLTVSGEGIVPGPPVVPGSEVYTYDPTLVSGNRDTLIMEYWFIRDEDTASVDFDTLKYIVGRIYKPIYIEDLNNVSIDSSIVNTFYCEANTLHLLSGIPSYDSTTFNGGIFTLYGGTGQYQSGDTLFNNVINPYLVNGSENAVTSYDLVYTLDGIVCKNSDTMNITISKGLYPGFVTASGADEFCDSDPDELIITNVVFPDTAIWKIGGVPQADTIFPPGPLDPGIHVVSLQMRDTFGCTATATDTFTINALPSLSLTQSPSGTPGLATQYCANDPIVDFWVGPSPGCPSFAAPGQYLVNQNFDVGIPPNWPFPTSPAGSSWESNAVLPQGGTGGAALVDTSTVVDNAWMFTDSLDFINGHTYRITYMVRAGAKLPACPAFCGAKLRVMYGVSQTTSMGGLLALHNDISNDQTYVRHTINYNHTGATGKYFIGFNCFSDPYARSLRLDEVRVRDITLGSCSLDGIGYINGPGVHNEVDSAYQFNPLAVTPGNIEVKYIYTDTKGCQDSIVYPITVDSFPIVSFTEMDSFYCENAPTIMLASTPIGGNFDFTLYASGNSDSNLVHVPFFAPTQTTTNNPAQYMTNVTGTDNITYTFTDGHGCTSSQTQTVVIVPMVDSNAISSSIDPFGIGHCANGASKTLFATSLPGQGAGPPQISGTFYGAGVRNGAGGSGVAMFHPDSAVIDMGHTGDVVLTYIYETTTGCVDTTRFTTHVHANPQLSFLTLPDSLCLNRDSFTVYVNNHVVTGPTGSNIYDVQLPIQTGTYTVTDTSGNPVPGFMVLFDRIVPSAATGLSQVNVQYSYTSSAAFGSCTSVINDSIRIDTVPNVYFQNLQPFYCENEPQSIMLAFPPYKVGSGYMIIDSLNPIDSVNIYVDSSNHIDSSFYQIDPLTMVGNAGSIPTSDVQYNTYYTYTDDHGCRGEVFDSFEIRHIERITFASPVQDTFCRQVGTFDLRNNVVAPTGGIFTDNLALTSIVDSFYLNLNSAAGPRLITYHYIDTNNTCYNNDSFRVYLFNGPDLDFNVYGGCSGMDITFDGSASNLELGIDSITRIWWDFGDGSANMISHLDTTPITIPDTIYQYGGTGIYNATLYVENQSSCIANVTKQVIVSPTVATYPYVENFDAGTGNWYNDQPISTTPNPLWQHQLALNGAKISSPSGAWVTMGDSLYQKDQKAWVYSPCFDMSGSQRPMIAMDVWRDLLEDIDGVIMEYYDLGSNSWMRLGDKDLGINWYQSNFVLSRPGNQTNTTYPRGWTNRGTGWESARYRLDQFKGNPFARFRIAFASSAQTVLSDYEGFAFDNVWIGERTRNVLVEHFDNVYYVTQGGYNSDVVDKSVYDKIFNSAYGQDVFLIQYQSELSSPYDFVNLRTDIDVAARTFLYSINDDNQIMVDGRSIGTGVSQQLSTYDLDYDMLQFPDFNIDISSFNLLPGNVVEVTSTTTALNNMPDARYAIHSAIIQDSFTINSNGFNMLSVMRKLLPDGAGVNEEHAWPMNSQSTVTQTWDYTGEIGQASFNPNQLEAIVFIQNMVTNEVYQVQSTQDLTKYTGNGKLEDEPAVEITKLKVYPNPSADIFNVEFEEALEGDYEWQLVDVAGRVLQTGTAQTGTQRFTIDAERLSSGAYFFVIAGENVYTQRKLIVARP